MEEEVEFDPPENGCTTVYWSGNSNLSVDADLKDSVESAMRKLAELHGHKIAEGKDALRYELLGKERYYPTFNDVVNMWDDEGDVNGWEALNITVHFKTMPMTASEAKESEFRGVLAGSHVGHRSTRDRGTSNCSFHAWNLILQMRRRRRRAALVRAWGQRVLLRLDEEGE